MPSNKKLIIVDIIRLNHWLNARKITGQFIKNKLKSLSKNQKNWRV